MLQEILDLGFEQVELGHGIRLSLMEGIQRYYDAGKVRFSTLHNFCPLPIEITRPAPDCYQFSSHREAERERAVKLSFQTIDFAKRLGAPLVVLHLGRVPIDRLHGQAGGDGRGGGASLAQVREAEAGGGEAAGEKGAALSRSARRSACCGWWIMRRKRGSSSGWKAASATRKSRRRRK